MAFDKTRPIGATDSLRASDNLIRTNWVALEAALVFHCDFITGSTQTGEVKQGIAKMYAGATAPTTKEDGLTALAAADVNRRLWLDTSVTPNVLKVFTAVTPTWTAIGTLSGLLDEDNMASDSAVLCSSQQALAAYTKSTVVAKTEADNGAAANTLTAAELNGHKTITNTGAGAETLIVMPAGVAGMKLNVAITVAQYLRFTTNGSEKFRFQSETSAAGGYIRTNTVGDAFVAVFDGTDWTLTIMFAGLSVDE